MPQGRGSQANLASGVSLRALRGQGESYSDVILPEARDGRSIFVKHRR
jgi:hypothetical protein